MISLPWQTFCRCHLRYLLTMVYCVHFLITGQPSLWQRSIQDRNHLSCRVPLQAPQDHFQDKDLPPQHWRERTGVLACHQCRKLEASHQNWSRWASEIIGGISVHTSLILVLPLGDSDPHFILTLELWGFRDSRTVKRKCFTLFCKR